MYGLLESGKSLFLMLALGGHSFIIGFGPQQKIKKSRQTWGVRVHSILGPILQDYNNIILHEARAHERKE